MSKDWKLNISRPSQPLIADLAVARPGIDVSKYLTTEFRAAVERLAFADDDTANKPERQTQQKRIRDLLPIAFPPDGRPPSNFTLQAVQRRLLPAFEKEGLKVPSTDSIARALGRRNRRG